MAVITLRGERRLWLHTVSAANLVVQLGMAALAVLIILVPEYTKTVELLALWCEIGAWYLIVVIIVVSVIARRQTRPGIQVSPVYHGLALNALTGT